jgi:hypothetical protein
MEDGKEMSNVGGVRMKAAPGVCGVFRLPMSQEPIE